MSWTLQEAKSIATKLLWATRGSQGRKQQVRVAWRGSWVVGATLYLLLVPAALSCQHWGDQEEGESSWVQGEVGGQVQGPQVLGLATSQPWEGPGEQRRAKGGEGGSTRVVQGSWGLQVWGSGEALWVPVRQVGTHHLHTQVAQGMVPFLGLFLDDLLVDKLPEHNEDVSEPRGAWVVGGWGRMVSFREERGPSEPGARSTRPALS